MIMEIMRAALVAIGSLLVCAACSTSSGQSTLVDGGTDTAPAACASDPRVQTYASGMRATGKNGKLAIELDAATPAPPAKDNNSWSIKLLDASGSPVSGATFTVKPFMPDHAHGSSIVPAVDPAGNPGDYTVTRLNLFMPGVWQITFNATTTDGTTDSIVFTFCIGE